MPSSTQTQQVLIEGAQGTTSFNQSIATANLWVNSVIGNSSKPVTNFAPVFVQSPLHDDLDGDGNLDTYDIRVAIVQSQGSTIALGAGVVIREYQAPTSFTLPADESGPFTLLVENGNRTIKNNAGTVLTTLDNSAAITISGTDNANDVLNVSFTGGNPLTGGVSFAGGEKVGGGDDDRLQVSGYNFPTADGAADLTLTHTGPESGNIQFLSGLLSFSQIEPLTLSGTAADMVITLSGTSDTAFLEDNGATTTDGMLRLRSPLPSFEQTDFAIPTNSLTINLGAGNDTFTVSTVPQFTSALTINGGTGDDTVSLNAPISFASGKDLNVDLQDDDATPGTDSISVGSNADLIFAGSGKATLKASRKIAMAAGSSIDTASGGIVLEANQQTAPTAGSFVGIDINGGIVRSTSGNITLAGRGGKDQDAQYGVYVHDSALIGDATTGLLTVTGTGGTTPAGFIEHFGVIVDFATIRSGGGEIQVNGTGGSDADNTGGHSGVFLSFGKINAGGAGKLTVTGTAGQSFSMLPNYGVFATGGADALKTVSGKMTVTGTGSTGVVFDSVIAAGADIEVTGTGDAATGFGIQVTGNVNTFSAGDIKLTADSLDLQGSVGAESRKVTLLPKTGTPTIDLGGADSATKLGLSSVELDLITAGTLNIGGASSGAITVSQNLTRTTSPAINQINLTSGGAISVPSGGGVLNSAGGNVTLTPGASPAAASFAKTGTDLNVGGGSVTFGSGAKASFVIKGTTPDSLTGHEVLNVIGNVNFTGADLVVTDGGSGFTPAAGNSFAIIKYTGSRGTTTFSNSSVVLNGVTLPITYDDGNKQVLLGALPAGTLSATLSSGNLTVTDVNGAKNNSLTISTSGTSLIIADLNETFTDASAGATGGTLSPDKKTLTIAGFAGTVTGSITVNGAGGDDTVTVDYGGGGLTRPIKVDAGSGTDSLVVQGTTNDDVGVLTGTGSLGRITLNGNTTDFQPNSNMESVTVNGLAGNDRFTVDYLLGEPLPSGGFTFNGGVNTGAPGDMLRVIGSGVQSLNYVPDVVTTGNGVITALPINGANYTRTITFTGLEPIDVANVDKFALTTSGGNDVVSLADGASFFSPTTAALRISGSSGGLAFETLAVWNVTSVLTIDAGTNDGNLANANDTINVGNATLADPATIGAPPTGAGSANVTSLTLLTGSAGTDAVKLNGELVNSGSVEIATGTIDVAGSVWSNYAILHARGPIMDGNGTDPNVSVSGFTATAGTGIDLDISAYNVSAAVSGTGDIRLRDTSAIFNLDASATNGTVFVSTPDIVNGMAVTGIVSGQAVTLAADNMAVTGTVNATGVATLKPFGANRPIDVGTETSNKLSLTQAELNKVMASRIVVGSGTAGAVLFTQPITLANSSALEVISGSTINDTGSATVYTDASLALNAAGGVGTGGNALNVAVSNLAATAAAGGVNVVNTGSVSIGTVGGVSGLTATGASAMLVTSGSITVDQPVSATGAGAVALTATGGSIALNKLMSAGTGGVTLKADKGISLTTVDSDVNSDGSMDFNADFDANADGVFSSVLNSLVTQNGANNPVTVTASDIVLDGRIDSGALTLQPSTANRTIAIVDSTGAFNIDFFELQRLDTKGEPVSIGRVGGTGEVNIAGDRPFGTDLPNYFFTLRGGDVKFNGTVYANSRGLLVLSSGAIIRNHATGLDVGGNPSRLLFDSNGGVGTLANPIRIDVVASVAARASVSGPVAIDGIEFNTGKVNGVNGVATNGGTIQLNGGTISVGTPDGNGSLNAGSGAIHLTTTGNDLSHGLGVISTISGGADSFFTANIINIGGSVNLGGAKLTIQPQANTQLINVGGSNVAGTTLGLIDDDLDRITAGTIQIGSASANTLTVSADITRSASTNIALVSGDDVVISGGQVNTGGGTLLLDPANAPKAVKPTHAGLDATASTVSFGSDLSINIAGTTVDSGYDQLNVSGTVDLTGVNLLLTGSFTPSNGQSFTIVSATSRTGFFTNLPSEGSTITFGGKTLVAHYTSTGVVLGVATAAVSGGNLVIDVGGGRADDITIVVSNNNYVISDPTASNVFFSPIAGATGNGTNTLTVPKSAVTGQIQFLTGDLNDRLTVDFTGGDFANAITYDGGTQTGTPGDRLKLTGGTFASASHVFTGASSGTIILGANSVGYTGLEPVDMAGVSVGNLSFTLPSAGSAAFLENDAATGNSISQIRSGGGTFETTTFSNPSGSLTISQGNVGDTLTVNSVPDLTASLSVGTAAAPLATINIPGAIAFASGKSLSAFASALTAGAAISASGSGSISLVADSMAINSPALLSASAAGSVTLTQLTAGTPINLGTETSGQLSLTDAESDRVAGGTVTIGDANSGTITVSALINRVGASVNFNLITGGNNSIVFTGTGSLDVGSSAATLAMNMSGSGAITSGGATADVTATSLSMTAGSGGIGASGNPVSFFATSVDSSTGGNANQFLLAAAGNTTIGAGGLSAGAGTIEFDGGTFNLSASNQINDSTKLVFNAGVTSLGLGANNETVAGVTMIQGGITGTTGVLTSTSDYLVQGGSMSVILAGSVGLIKTGSGTTSLNKPNTYTGDTTITNGTLRLLASGVIPDGSGKGNVVMNPASGTATLDLGGFNETVNGLSSSGAGSSIVDNTVGPGSLNLIVGGNNISSTFGGVIQNTAGSLSLSKTGSGTLILSGANTYSGTTSVNQGALSVSGGSAIPDASDVTVASGASLSLAASETIGALNGAGGVTNTTAATLTVINGGVYSGVMANGTGTQSLTVNGPGKTLTVSGNSNSYTGATNVNGGTLLVNGSVTSNVTVNNGGTLGGSGTINSANSITVNSGGHLAPGTSPGTLNSGTVALASGASFDVELNGTTAGTQYDQQVVNGTGAVTLGGATLNLTVGGTAPVAGNTYRLIDKVSSGAVTPQFNNLPEGKTFTSGSTLFQISYQGGTGNDVVLTALDPFNPVLQGTTGNDVFNVIRSGGNFDVSLNGSVIYSNAVGSITSLTINGLNGNDTLTVDLSAGNVFPTGGITYRGGENAADDDRLKVIGYNLPTADGLADLTVTHSGAEAGSVTLATLGTVNFAEIEPLTLAGTAADMVITLPSGGNPDATLGDDGVAALGDGTNDANTSALYDSTSPRSFEYTEFADPTNTLKINRVSASDNLTVLDLVTAGLNAGLTIGAAGAEFNQVNFAGPVTLGLNKNLAVNALSTISLSAATSDLTVSGTGKVDLTTAAGVAASSAILLTAGSSITTANGDITLSANQQPTPSSGNFVGIHVLGGTIQTSGSGKISLSGRGGNDTATPQHYGVWVQQGGSIKSTATGASAGTITINGTGGIGDIGLSDSAGVRLGRSSGTDTSSITSIDGNVSITGVATSTTGSTNDGFTQTNGADIDISNTGAGILTITGTAGSTDGNANRAIRLSSAGIAGTILRAPQVNLIGDRMSIDTVGTNYSFTADALATIRPLGGVIVTDLGASSKNTAGTLELSNSELLKIVTPTLTVGSATSGAINVTAGLTRPAGGTLVNLISGNSINFASPGGQISTGGKNLTLNPGSGNITVNSTGTEAALTTVTPPAAGTLSFASGAKLLIPLNGTNTTNEGNQAGSYNRLRASGIVDLSGLSLNLTGTRPAQPIDPAYTIVENTSTSATSNTFTNLPEGKVFRPSVDGFGTQTATFQITYKGGSGSNDVILTTIDIANPVLSSSGTDDVWLVRRNSLNLDVTLNGTVIWSPLFSSLTSLTINAGAGNDTLTVDLSAGDAVPSGGVAFGGESNTATGDKLIVTGGAQGNVTYDYTSANDGSIVMSAFGTVSYTGVEQPLSNNGTATDVTLTLPGTNDVAFLEDNGFTPADGLLRWRSGAPATFLQTDFAIPTSSLTLNGGAGNDTLTVAAAPQFTGALTINGGTEDDTVNLNGSITFAANKNLNVDLQDDDPTTPGVDAINVGANAALSLSGTGTATLTASKNIALSAASSLTATANVFLNATGPGGGGFTAGNFVGIDVNGATISSTNGLVSLTGRGGTDLSGLQIGVLLRPGSTVSGGELGGTGVNIAGTGGGDAASGSNVGVLVSGTVTSTNGARVLISGTGGSGSGDSNYGVWVSGAGASIGSGGGDVQVTGVEGAGTSGVAITTSGIGASILTPASGGALTLIGNSMLFGPTSTIGAALTSSVMLKPFTDGVGIDLGQVTDTLGGPLGLTDTELDRITAGTINIGDANSGPITITAAIDRAVASPAAMNLTSGGAINFSTGSIDTAGKNLKLTPGAAASVGVASTLTEATVGAGTLSLASGSNLAIPIVGATTFDQLKVSGNVDLTGVNLVLSGAYSPLIGNKFTIVDNTLATGVTSGTFNGLPEGKIFNPSIDGFGPQNIDFQITYRGGTDSNDVVLTAINVPPTLSPISNQSSAEDDVQQTVNLSGISAGGTQPQSLTVTATSDNQTLLPDGNISILYTSPGATGQLKFKTADDQNGTVKITVTVTDSGGSAAGSNTFSQTFTLNVSEKNDAPTANVDTPSVTEDDPAGALIDVLLNDSKGPANESSQTLTITGVGTAAHGSVAIESGQIRYIPTDTDYNGPDSFTYTITDNGTTAGSPDPLTATGTVNITVTEKNDSPTAQPDTATVAEDSIDHVVTVLANDLKGPTNEGTQTLKVINASAEHGTVTINADGTLNYSPTGDYNGSDTITYTIRDNGTTAGANDFLTSISSVSVTVTEKNDAPVATSDTATIAEDSLDNVIDVLANDLKGADNESNQSLTVIDASALHGTVAINPDGTLNYSPAGDYNGPDTITYTIRDDGATNGLADPLESTGAVAVTVTEENDAPSASDNQIGNIQEDADPVVIPFTTLVGDDSKGPANEGGQTLTVSAVGNAFGGSVQIVGTDVVFTPAGDFNGMASFVYTLSDDGTTAGAPDPLTSTAIVTFTIDPENDAPSFQNLGDQSAEDESFNIVGGVKVYSGGPAQQQTVAGWAHSFDFGPADEDAAQQVKQFYVSTPDTSLFTAGGQPKIDNNGNLTFTPAPNAHGTAVVTVTLQDDGGVDPNGADTSDPATAFNITITKAHPFHNTTGGANNRFSADVTDLSGTGLPNGKIQPIDAITIINFLNTPRLDRNLPNTSSQGIALGINSFGGAKVFDDPVDDTRDRYAPFIDVIPDNFIKPDDAQEVINYINRRQTSEGEGTLDAVDAVIAAASSGETAAVSSVPAQPAAQISNLNDLVALLAADVAAQPKRRGA